MYGLKQRDLDALLHHLRRIRGIEKAWLFGPRAMGNYKVGSDIDIAVSGIDIDRDDLLHTIDLLNEVEPIPFFVEIVCFEEIDNPMLKDHILTHGKLLLENKADD